MKLKVALAQMLVEANTYDSNVKVKNLEKVLEMIKKGAKSKADLIVLPEDFIGGYAYGPINMPPEQDKDLFPLLSKWAQEYKICVAGATLNRYNFIQSFCCSFFIEKNGEVIKSQKRIHRYESEKNFVDAGDNLEVIDTSIGKVGFLIGLDILFPELGRKLKELGAEIIISPVQFFSHQKECGKISYDYPKTIFQAAAVASALENNYSLIMCNSVGIHAHSKQKLSGESIVISPAGIIAKLKDVEICKTVEIDDNYDEIISDIPIADINCISNLTFEFV